MRCALLFLVGFAAAVLMWLNTGSVSLYGATLREPIVVSNCHYLFNIDHGHFLSIHKLLVGERDWMGSQVLRRMLYPVLALPFTAFFGFSAGGVIFNFVLYGLALVGAWYILTRRYPLPLGFMLFAIFATSPIFAYWMGSPYSYAAILPASVLAWEWCRRICGSRMSASRFVLLSVCVGTLGLLHDSIAVFSSIAVATSFFRQRLFLRGAGVLVLMATPLIVVEGAIVSLARTQPLNPNTQYYLLVPLSFLRGLGDERYWQQLVELPWSLGTIFFFGFMVGLPLFAIGMLATGSAAGSDVRAQRLTEKVPAWLISFLGVFLVLHLAPMYDTDFSLRGASYARFYQFFYFPLLIWCGDRFLGFWKDSNPRRFGMVLGVGVVVLHLLILTGPIGVQRLSGWIYRGFYDHGSLLASGPETLTANLDRFGVHPFGSPGCPFWLND